jgi:DNA-binding MarR family transcriptional regulator
VQRGPLPDPPPADTAPDASPPPERRISLPFDIFALSQRLGTYLDRALEGTGVRPSEYAVYSLMLEAGPRTPSELAGMLGMPLARSMATKSAGCWRAATPDRRGHDDGRSVRLVLTDRGRGVVRTVNPAFRDALVALEAGLERPVDEVRAVLLEIQDAIDRADAARRETDTSSS